MKKTVLKISLLALAATLACTACIRENEHMEVTVPTVTLRVSIPEKPFTKAGFTVPDEGTGLHLKWMSGDQLRVINHASPAQNAAYDIQTGFTDHSAEFSGPAVSGDYYDILAPGSYASVEEAVAGNPDLTQNGNGSTAHLVFTALLENVPKALLDAGDIAFTSDWATTNGITLKRGGIVKLVLTLPAAVTAPKKVTLTGLGPDVSVNISNVDLSAEHVLTAYAQGSWDDIALAAGAEFTVSVLDQDGTCYAVTKSLPAAATLKGGMQNSIKITDGFTEQLFAGGKGTAESPWLIANAKQLDNMHVDGVLEHGVKKYFRLIENIDMEDYLDENTWVPLNMENPYDLGVNLDGDGHTIDNFAITTNGVNQNKQTGFFGVLYGDVYDLTITNATVKNTYGKPTGILCGYCGYSGKPAHVYNVHVNGSVTYNSSLSGADASGGVGALAGRIHTCLIESCSAFDITVTSAKQYAGGLFGYDWEAGSTIRNCWTSGIVTGNGQRTGAIAGALIRRSTSLINCYSIAEVHAPRGIGGIAGYCNMDSSAGTGYETNMPDCTITGCIAWQTELRTDSYSATSNNDWWSSGAIVSGTSTHNYLSNCWRRSNLDFRDFSGEITLYDQEDASASVPLVVSNPKPGTFKNYYPYHGKAAGATETLSDVARRIGWSEVVWDLSGNTPVLTGALEPAPSSGADAIPAGNAGSGPKYPSAGNGWTVTSVSDGITYYHYDNKNYYSTSTAEDFEKRHQDVFIVDVDLNNPAYQVKMVYASPSAACSQVFETTSAYAAINAGYERSSIAIKANARYEWVKNNKDAADNVLNNVASSTFTSYPEGLGISYIPNSTITDTGVPNWKNHGTIYFDGKRGVQIAFDGYDPAKAPGGSGNPPVKSLEEQRLFYQLNTSDKPSLLSSAPVLIHNYNQVGKSFKTWYPKVSGESTEAPNTHQTSLSPRTAVALNADNHLLLIVVDGRYSASLGGEGMSAYWLTQFLAKYFNPQYALNLDGGGSTTMCVQGQGDATTHVVNYPGDNRTQSGHAHDHEGQRARDTFIVIVPAE